MSTSVENEPVYMVEFQGQPKVSAAAFIVDRIVLRHFNDTEDRFIQMEQVAERIAPWRSSSEVRIMQPKQIEDFWKSYDANNFLGSMPGGPVVHVDRRKYIEKN